MPVQRISRLCAGAASALTVALLVAGPVLAAEGEHSKGLPQLNPASYASQIFWLIVTFGLLLWLMSKVALPRVAEVLEARQEKISNDLEKAGALKAEAEAVLQAYEKALAEARGTAQQELAKAVAAAAADAAHKNGELSADLTQRARAAEERIQAAKQVALGNVRAIAGETAQVAVSHLVGIAVSGDASASAVDTVLKERA